MGFDPFELVDRRTTAFAVTLVVALAVYVGFQLAFDGRVNLLESATFAVVFSAVLFGLSRLRAALRD
ncbi:MAG: hypothetical protein ABEJ92_09530 [Halobacteriales archaeon]